MSRAPAALDGVKVLDLTRVLAGPWCTQIFADLGADVTKVERPGSGDDTRDWGPPFLAGPNNIRGDAAYFLACNRGKRSVVLDLAAAAGQDAVRALAKHADILVENYKVGALAKYGLDYLSLKSVNPGLVYCSITGFGQDGPYRDRPGYDFVVQGIGGLMAVTGERDDRPGGGPQKVGVAVADLFTGMYAAAGCLAALLHRRATGEGQHVELGLLDTQIAILANLNQSYFISGRVPGREGNAHQNICPYQTFKTADEETVIIAVGNDGQFGALCTVAGRPELARDPRFARNSDRVASREILVPILAAVVGEKVAAFWLKELDKAGVPVGRVNSLEQVWTDPQVRHRGLRVALPHPLAPDLTVVGSPLKLSRTPVRYDRAPPLLGGDTDAVLTELFGADTGPILAGSRQ